MTPLHSTKSHRRVGALLRCFGAAAPIVVLATAGPMATIAQATPPAVTLTQAWIQDLNDAPCGVALASPVEATLDSSGPSVEVGDRMGYLYAFHIASGGEVPTAPAGWSSGTGHALASGGGCGISGLDNGTPAMGIDGTAVAGNVPIDSTASAISNPSGTSNVFFGTGNAYEPVDGGYHAWGATGSELWNQVVVNPPTDNVPDNGVQASLSIGQSGGVPFVNAGSLGQETYTMNASNGVPLSGWPSFSADSVFSTAAVGDLYGTGHDELVVGGASSTGFAYGRHYQDGGHVRIYNDHGGLICAADTNEEIDSSPAVGPILPGGALGIATGTGSYFGGSDEDTVKVFDTQCHQVWSDRLDGTTGGSPALADVQGNGQLAVVEGTVGGNGYGSVWALNASTGAVIWQQPVIGAVIGSVATADLTGSGYQDVIVPTTHGLEILDGKTGAEVTHVDDGSGNGGVPVNQKFGFQNAPLITNDGSSIGITVAGYFAINNSTRDVQGMVQHFTVTGSNGALVGAPGGWPQFHHDPSLSGFTGTPTSGLSGCQRPPAASNGYLTVASDGGVFSFGGQQFCGSTGNLTLNKPVVGMGQAPDQGGYWLVASDGGIFTFGDAQFYGSTGNLTLNKPIVGMAVTPDGKGYWLVAADGGIFTFGDAQFYGAAASVPNLNVVGMAPSPDGQGYWEVTSDGRVFPYGDAVFQGDASHYGLNAPLVGITPDPTSGGYWLVGSDGGIFSFGAPFFGSTGNIHLNQPVVAMQATDDGGGYWFVAADGGVFSYGDAPFSGSTGNIHLNRPMVGMVGF
ncbi:MAG TPA: hypothetical protein VND70_03745 [Acidimicrobiales bacterium]|nr:hypothetical protein [Acidimicrobiales bacterium]